MLPLVVVLLALGYLLSIVNNLLAELQITLNCGYIFNLSVLSSRIGSLGPKETEYQIKTSIGTV